MRDAIHYAIAALIVGFPLYAMSLQLWFRKFKVDTGKVESKVTRWITYLVLLVASVTMVGDLIAILYMFLQGEVTVRFFLKGLTLFSIAGAVFGFYLLERKKVQYRKKVSEKVFRIFGWVLFVDIAIGIALGFIVAGTPGLERMRTLDTERSSDLQSTARCIVSYTEKFEEFPSSLEDFKRSSDFSYCDDTRDPETGGMYEYRVVRPLVIKENGLAVGEFELCADFALASEEYSAQNNESVMSIKGEYLDTSDSKWYTHTAGRFCEIESVSFRAREVQLEIEPQVLAPVVLE